MREGDGELREVGKEPSLFATIPTSSISESRAEECKDLARPAGLGVSSMNFAPLAVLCRVVSRYVPVEDKAFSQAARNHCLPEAAKRAVELPWCWLLRLPFLRSKPFVDKIETFLDKVDAKARSRRAHEMKSCRSPTRTQHFITPYQTSESIMRCIYVFAHN